MSTQKALWSSHEGHVFKELPIVQPGPGEILIKNVVVASNPKDWKWVQNPGRESVEGNDVAGYVEAVGEGVTEHKKGDKVAAFTKMGDQPKWGAYQEYSTALAVDTFPLGPNTSFEDAATLPLALGTALIGLYKRLQVPLFTTPVPADPPTPIVVYGASSSVGSFVVQLAKLSGLYVVGVAGAGGEYAKSVGADVVVDYRGKTNEQIVQDIRAAVKGDLHYVYDSVSSKDTINIAVELLREKGGRFTILLGRPKDLQLPNNVVLENTFVASAYGQDAEFSGEFYRRVAVLLDAGTFKPNKAKVLPGGLAAVEGGLKLLKEGKVSAEKLVYRIADTPGLKA